MPTLWISDGDDGALVPLESGGYVDESEFQRLLADRPELLASAIDHDESRWLLVDRELDIRADLEGDSTTWRLDHLFLTPDAVPVLVEVKRSSDPRARREVVAQMLDYAASFALDWSSERLRGRLAGGEQALADFLPDTPFEDQDAFWDAVSTNIAAGRLRLLFVADRLSATLVRIIEFLNAQLATVEVLGVEVLRHTGGTTSIVAYQPAVRGRTAKPAGRRASGERRSQAEFDAVVEARHGPAVVSGVGDLLARAQALGATIQIGTDEENPKLFVGFPTPTGRTVWPIGFGPGKGKLIVGLRYVRHHPAFEDESARAELVDRLAAAAGVPAEGSNLGGFPHLPIAVVADADVRERLLDVLRWVLERTDVPLRAGG